MATEPMSRSEAIECFNKLYKKFEKEAKHMGFTLKDKTKKDPDDWNIFMNLELTLNDAPSAKIREWVSFCKQNTGKNSTIPDRLLVPEAIHERPALCKRYEVNGKMVFLIEYKPRGRKYQFICTGADGSEQKYSLKEFFASTTRYVG